MEKTGQASHRGADGETCYAWELLNPQGGEHVLVLG